MELKDALEKLRLNDAALSYEPKLSSTRSRFSLRVPWHAPYGCHPRADRTRIQIEIIATAPSVVYHVHLTNGEMMPIDNPSLYRKR